MTNPPPVSPATFFKGMAMGVAEVIPGVSGGTIALVTRVYARLLGVIGFVLSPAPFRTLRRDGLAATWRALDGTFLVVLLAGMGVGIAGGIFGVTHLIEHYPPAVWGFFFGLIVASVVYVGRLVSCWRVVEGVALLAGAAIAYWITVASPLGGSQSLLAVFGSGAIAICAFLLPGVSGSFVLLLLGMYTYVMTSLRLVLSQQDGASMAVVGVFAAGCLTGMAGFSRLLTWTYGRFPNPTLAVLTGFMIGSLNKLWPWRNVLEYRLDSHGAQVPFREANVLPGAYQGEPLVLLVIVAAALGLAIVLLLELVGRRSGGEPRA